MNGFTAPSRPQPTSGELRPDFVTAPEPDFLPSPAWNGTTDNANGTTYRID
jgi:hypothetical protein